MPELLEKKVSFSARHLCHDHIEQQAVIFICGHAGVLVCKQASALSETLSNWR